MVKIQLNLNNMETIPTAEKFCRNKQDAKLMIEFAKLHAIEVKLD